MYYTYVLKNLTGKTYIGQTNNLEARLFRHNSDMVRSTKNKGPWKIIFSKKLGTRKESINYESYLKSLKKPDYVKKIVI